MRTIRFGLVAIVVALGRVTLAAPHEGLVKVPAGWTETTVPGMDDQLKRMRDVPQTIRADASVYLSADQQTQLTILEWTIRGSLTTRSGLEILNRGVMVGGRAEGTGHVSDEASFDGDQLVADQVDLANHIRIHQHRRFAVDRDGITHMVSAMCANAATDATCEGVIAAVQLTVPNQVAPEERPRSISPYQAGYRIGQVVGVVLVIALLAGIFLWSRRKKA